MKIIFAKMRSGKYKWLNVLHKIFSANLKTVDKAID